jgi:hypothetical protein
MHKAEDFLALAYQAEQAAVTALSPIARNCWLNLAAEYRKLAALECERSHGQQHSSVPRTAEGP